MKVLLDENIPHDLRPFLAYHDAFTAAYVNWTGIRNGELLAAAEKEGFEVLVTGDLGIAYQQNLTGRKLAIVSLSAVNWPVIEPYVDKIVRAVDKAEPGSFTRVECGVFTRRSPRTRR